MRLAPVFDELVQQSTRIRLCAALEASVEMEFSSLRQVVEVSNFLLS